MPEQVKVLTQNQLIALTRKAMRERKNRRPHIAVVLSLSDGVFPVTEHFLHNDSEVRATIAISARKTLELDIDIADFNALPSASV